MGRLGCCYTDSRSTVAATMFGQGPEGTHSGYWRRTDRAQGAFVRCRLAGCAPGSSLASAGSLYRYGDVWLFDGGKAKQPVGLTTCAGLSFLDFKPVGLTYDTIRKGNYEPTARLEDMDIDGIWAQVLYPSVTLTGAKPYGDEPELQRFCVRAYNEWLAEFCAGSDGRLIGQAIIPATNAADALEELEWGMKNGHKGAVISRFPNGSLEHTDEDDKFFALA